MKPFDLEKAKAGEPLVTREGRAATDFTFHPTSKGYQFSAVVCGSIETFCGDGSFVDPEEVHDNDLFMAEKPKVKRNGYSFVTLKALEDKCRQTVEGAMALADKYADDACRDRKDFVIIKVEWEEESP